MFEPGERVSGTADETMPQHLLDQPRPPARRETEVSVVRDATAPGLDGGNLDHLVVDHSEGKPHVDFELARRLHSEHLKDDPQPETGTKHQTVTNLKPTSWTIDELRA